VGERTQNLCITEAYRGTRLTHFKDCSGVFCLSRTHCKLVSPHSSVWGMNMPINAIISGAATLRSLFVKTFRRSVDTARAVHAEIVAPTAPITAHGMKRVVGRVAGRGP